MMLAIVPVRAGELPAGGAEVVAEAGGRVVLIGEGTNRAAAELAGIAIELACWEVTGFEPGRWAEALSPWLSGDDVVLLPASPDGRDLAPRVALACNWPLVANALAVSCGRATISRHDGTQIEELAIDGPFVATLVPGVRGVIPADRALPRAQQVEDLLPIGNAEAHTVEILPADPATVELAAAVRLVAGGAGLGDAAAFELLRAVGLKLGAALGGTRVVTDRGWLEHERQIGTTGVAVDPRLYLAFGISGAVQHTAGLGQPDHVISVNLDPSCPMMGLSQLALVADAPATLRALAARLGLDTGLDTGAAE